MNRARSALIVATFSVWSVERVAGECIVIAPATLKKSSQSVFAGRLEDQRATDGAVELTFEVSRVWKGAVPQRVILYQLPPIDMVVLAVGGSHVVFPQPLTPEHRLHLRLPEQTEALLVPDCSGAMDLEPELIRQLGRGRSPRRAG